MARFTDTIKVLIERFRMGGVAAQPAGLEALRKVLNVEEFEVVMTALQVEADHLQAVEMVDSLVSTRRHDDRTNLIEEIAFRGGWRRDKGKSPSEMYLSYMVIITNPDPTASLDDQRNVSKGIPISGPGDSVVYTPRNGDGRVDVTVDADLRKSVDFVQYLREEDAKRAGLELHRNVAKNRYEWPVVKCHLKPHFMLACQVLVFDKEMNLAWQGAFRRGALTKQDAEKMYARLNWMGPVSKSNLAGYYVLMMHSGIGPVANWPQWEGLALGGETFHERNRRFHTYGSHLLVGQSPQWAIINWIFEHGIENWNTTSMPVETPRGYQTWTSTQFLESAKDDLVFHAYDLADNARLEDLYRDVEDGDVTIKDGDDLIKMSGKTQLYSHREDSVRNRIVREAHIAVSEGERAEMQKEFKRETITRSDIVKFYNSDRGAFHRIPEMQDEWRDKDLDLMDDMELRWFTHPQLGLGGLGMATRAAANSLIEKGFGKHRKKLSLWGNRDSWQGLLRFADGTEERFLYDLLQSAAGARILDSSNVKNILRNYGKGYDPDPECQGFFRNQPHRHDPENAHLCWARRPGEGYGQWMDRVVSMRISSAVLAGWLNMVFDNRGFLIRYLALGGITDPVKRREKALEMMLAGKGSPEFYLTRAEIKRHQVALKDKEDLDTEFGFVADILLATVSKENIQTLKKASLDVWFDLMMFVLGEGIKTWPDDKDLRKSHKAEYEGYAKSCGFPIPPYDQAQKIELIQKLPPKPTVMRSRLKVLFGVENEKEEE